MLSTSDGFRRRVADGARVLLKAQLVFPSGRRRDIEGIDIMMNGFSFEQMTSSTGSFDIGAAIVGTFKCTLNNFDRRFEDEDFEGARILPQIGVEVDGAVEWLRKGTYWVQQPGAYSGTISLSCDDSMSLLDVPFSGVGATFPTTAAVLLRDICAHCGLAPLSMEFPGSRTVFKGAPEDSATCRDVVSWIAQATGNYARMTADDRLQLAWYDPTAFDDEDWLDGGELDEGRPSYATGDSFDGGDFIDYSSGDSFDGGDFVRGRVLSIWATASEEIATDDVVVTGIRVTASDEVLADGSRGRDGETALVGMEGYVLEVSGNPLIAWGEARAAAERIAASTVGLRFRPFDVSAIGDPRAEAGDPAVYTDRHQKAHRTFLTAVSYKVGQYAAYRCTAKSPARNSASGAGAVTKALRRADAALRREQTAREIAQRQLQDDLENSSGMYTTEEEVGGGTVLYQHDKPSLADSQFVWKVSAGGFGLSTDGGKTYPYGLDKWGKAILDTVYAIGIDADYITTGALRVRRGDKTVFCVDTDTGEFWWDAQYSQMTNDGKITAVAGKIGDLTLAGGALYSGKSSLDAVKAGTYLGADGVSTCGNDFNDNASYLQWNVMSKGMFYGGMSKSGRSQKVGYLSFSGEDSTLEASTAAVLAGKSALIFAAPRVYVAKNYYEPGASHVLAKAVTGNYWLGTSISWTGSSVSLARSCFHFLNGLLVGVDQKSTL